MKTTISIIALMGIMTTAAMADTANLDMKLERFVSGANPAALTETQRDQVENIMNSGGTFSERQSIIRSLLAQADAIEEDTTTYVVTEMAPEETKLEIELQRFGDYDIDSLTDAEKLQVQDVINGSGTMSEKSEQIASIFS